MEDQEPADWEPDTSPKFEDLRIASIIGNWPIDQTFVTHAIKDRGDEEE
jgi:hypothetical protein